MPMPRHRLEPLTHNSLLDALPADVRDRLLRGSSVVTLRRGEVLSEPGPAPDFIYFPISAIVSVQYTLADGASTELGVVGQDGAVGVAALLGGGTTLNHTVVDAEGAAYRVRALRARAEFALGGVMQQVLLRYAQVSIMQIAQAAVCNRHHSIEQAVCRWLLMRLDRQASVEVTTTQERIAHMLGVRREAVTGVVGQLQHAGLISCTRGHVTLLDRAGLEARCCECYRVVNRESERLLPASTAGWTADAGRLAPRIPASRRAGAARLGAPYPRLLTVPSGAGA